MKTQPPAPTVGDRIRSGRQAIGWTGEALGRALGTSKARISAVERGVDRPSLEWLRRCADALGIRLADLAPEVAGEVVDAPDLVLTLAPTLAPGKPGRLHSWGLVGPGARAVAKRVGIPPDEPIPLELLGITIAHAVGKGAAVLVRGDRPEGSA